VEKMLDAPMAVAEQAQRFIVAAVERLANLKGHRVRSYCTSPAALRDWHEL
jgi:hypothetical protein